MTGLFLFRLTFLGVHGILTTEVVNNVAQKLVGLLNLTEYEARAYLGLVEQGVLTGYAVAKATHIPASKSYEAVDGLARKGGAVVLPGDPVRYAAVPADALLLQAQQRHAADLESLRTALSEAAEAAATLDELPPLWRAGREAGLAQSASRIGTARRSVIGAVPVETRSAFEQPIADAARRGVLVQIVGSGDEALTLLIDDHEAIIGSLADPIEIVGTGNPAIVALCRTRLRAASSSPFLRPADDVAEWLRWEEQKGLRLLHAAR